MRERRKLGVVGVGGLRRRETAGTNLLPLSRQSPTRQCCTKFGGRSKPTFFLPLTLSVTELTGIASALNGGLCPPFVDQLVIPMFEQPCSLMSALRNASSDDQFSKTILPFRFDLSDDAYTGFEDRSSKLCIALNHKLTEFSWSLPFHGTRPTRYEVYG